MLRPPRNSLALVAVVLASCTTAAGPLTAIATGALKGLNAPPAAVGQTQRLLLFGGQGHDTYLGCLSCSRYDAESVLNSYSEYGSRYSPTSILNPYSEFGSRYSTYSACSPHAADPPVIVDGGGGYYGRLTLNRAQPDQVHDERLLGWLAGVCSR